MADAQIRITANTRQAERALGRVNGSLTTLGGAARAATAALATIGAGRALRGIVETTANFQDLRDTLASVTGSVQEGAAAFEYLTELQNKTQFGVSELADSFIQLTANGVTPAQLGLSDMNELFAVLTDSAAAVNGGIDVLQTTTSVLARSLASGAVELEEINRLADRGIPVFDILADRLDLTKTEINEFSKEGDNAKLVLRELIAGIQERFGGATARRVDNVTTQFSNLKNSIALAADAIGRQGFAAAIGATAEQITNFIENNDALIQQIGMGLVKGFLYLKEVIKIVIANIEFLAKAFAAFFALKIGMAVGALAMAFGKTLVNGLKLAALATVGLTKVMLRNPILAGATAAIAGVELLTGAISDFLRKIGVMDKAEEVTEALGLNFETLKENGIAAAEALGLNLESLQNIGDIREEVNRLAEEYNLDSQQAAAIQEELAAATGATADAAERSADAADRTDSEFKKILQSAEDTLFQTRLQLVESEEQRAIMQAQRELGRELTEQEETRLRAVTKNTTELERQVLLSEAAKRISEEYIDSIKAQANDIRQTALGSDLSGQIADVQQARQTALDQYEAIAKGSEQEIADARVAIEREAQRRIDAIREQAIERRLNMEGKAIAESLSKSDRETLQRIGQQERQQEYTRDRIEFEKKSEAQKAQFVIQQGADVFSALGQQNKEAFEAAKAFNIANAIMNTYMAATKALASYPPPFNYIAAAAAVGMGLAQVAQIRSQTYSPRALGGPVQGNSPYLVGERGPELFVPGTAGSIVRNQDVGSSGPVNVNFNIQTNDARGFDDLLMQRRSMITQMVGDAMEERGKRSMI